ncbi:carboxypeptidase-like regulatory domain-containing protein [Polaribacter cellanae]|uniref:Carboxypeptidase-like regulatory domain-containing protein n=1 Tax=Polaribacter cellanae TaxID=2818493 RepID=A0A975CNM2_9FLAO|nr:carboxypeptidase-like regulatory domain-containing protein [Polaribacter cellanae]QTE22928.1 carboxypeptidase-like regulatory domain-containing protein [Polaribacter cellanae]
MKRTLPILFISISFTCFSQKNKMLFFGKIIDSSNVVKNVHIINLQTKRGTFSNEAGVFEILASENDTLQISSIGFKTKKIKVENFHFREKINFISIQKEIYTLNEFTLKRHNLIGTLSLDIKSVPKDYKADLVQKLVSDIKKIDYNAISKMPVKLDEIHLSKPTVAKLPNYFEGFGPRFGGGSSNNDKSLKEELEKKKNIPEEILKEFGDYFFFVELKIPKESYYNFITYCSYKGIFKLYKNKQTLKVLEILKAESVSYLKLLNKE